MTTKLLCYKCENWVPAGASFDTDRTVAWPKYKSGEKMPHESKHQVHLSYGIDTQFVFEDAENARWFWNWGNELVIEDRSFDSKTLWIDGREIETKGNSHGNM